MFDMIADQRIASCPPRGRESLGGQLTVYFLFEYGEATFVAIELVCDAKSGTLYWGCPQVESGRMANAFNLVTDGDFSLTTNNTAASTTRLFPKQWKVTGAGVSTSTLNCIVTDRAVNDMPDSVSGNAMRLTCKPSATDVYIAQDVNARGAKGDVFTVSGWCNSLSVASGGTAVGKLPEVPGREAATENECGKAQGDQRLCTEEFQVSWILSGQERERRLYPRTPKVAQESEGKAEVSNKAESRTQCP